MIDPNILEDEVLNTLAMCKDLDWNDEVAAEKVLNWVKTLSVEDVLNEYMIWHGMIGYTSKIIMTYESAKAASGTRIQFKRSSWIFSNDGHEWYVSDTKPDKGLGCWVDLDAVFIDTSVFDFYVPDWFDWENSLQEIT